MFSAADSPPQFGYNFEWMARYPSGKGEVCKTFMRGFDSHPRLQFLQALACKHRAYAQVPTSFSIGLDGAKSG